MNIKEQHAKKMRIRAIRLQVELCSAELEQLIVEEPTGVIRNEMTDANIALQSTRMRLKSIGERIS